MVIGSERGIHQIIEDSIGQSHEGQVPFVIEQPVTRAWDMVGKPAAVAARYEEILCPVPYNDGACVGDVEAPVAKECKFVVPESYYTTRHPNSDRLWRCAEPASEEPAGLSIVTTGPSGDSSVRAGREEKSKRPRP